MLDSDNPLPTATAIRELSLRRLFRNEVTEKVLPLLSARNRKVSKIAFAAVENLESDRAIPALIEMLGDAYDAPVQADALHALCRITGEQRPGTRAAWDSFLR
jgi:HEAT repeat protein